jgi:glyoxylase-like metal-dependent hydrolase (beta-lactamase superfamily II)
MQFNRRQFCSLAMAAPALGAQSATSPPLIDRGFASVSLLADGVYVTIANPEKGLQCLSNGGVIVGRERVLLVEGHFQPAGAALEAEVAGTFSKAPVMAAIDSHYHLDHTFGKWRLRGTAHPDHGARARTGLDEGAICGAPGCR